METTFSQNVCGVICEYNPFHKGHAYHLKRARELSNAQVVVCVMSGPFTQRGDAALLSPRVRAEMALKNGADVVVELPAFHAVRDAEFFALGGVSILAALGATHLSFGCESGDIDSLWKAAKILEQQPDIFLSMLEARLQKGWPYAKAQGDALEAALGHPGGGLVSAPNNVLAICYLRALLRLKSNMIPVPVLRLGDYHDTGFLTGFASATALREAVCRGDWRFLEQHMPQNALPLLKSDLEEGRVHRPEALDLVLREKLRLLTPDNLCNYPGVSEGLDQRVARLAPLYATRLDLLAAIKTKRYTYARLNRLMAYILLGFTKEYFWTSPPGDFRLLGFTPAARPYLKAVSPGLLYTKPARRLKERCFLLDMTAYDLWAMGAGLPLGEGYRQQVVRAKAGGTGKDEGKAGEGIF